MGSCGWFPLPQEEIVAWVEAHRDTLPTTLEELSRFPVAFRRVIVGVVSPEQRTRFWEAHLRTFLEPNAGLTPAQRDFVTETIPLLADLFGCAEPQARERASWLEQRVRQLFSPQQAAAIFGTVGPAEPPGGLPLPPGTRLTPAM